MFDLNCRLKRLRCFTLIELLVVIAILAVLSSLVQTSLKSVFEKTQKIQCTSNLKQLGSAAMMYEEDYNGEMVMSSGERMWTSVLPPYLGMDIPETPEATVFCCPTQFGWKPQSTTYGMNNQVGNDYSRSELLNLRSGPGRIGISSTTIPYFVDGWFDDEIGRNFYLSWRNGGSWNSGSFGQHPWSQPHYRGANIVFLDGHVQWMGIEEDIWNVNKRPGLPGKFAW